MCSGHWRCEIPFSFVRIENCSICCVICCVNGFYWNFREKKKKENPPKQHHLLCNLFWYQLVFVRFRLTYILYINSAWQFVISTVKCIFFCTEKMKLNKNISSHFHLHSEWKHEFCRHFFFFLTESNRTKRYGKTVYRTIICANAYRHEIDHAMKNGKTWDAILWCNSVTIY